MTLGVTVGVGVVVGVSVIVGVGVCVGVSEIVGVRVGVTVGVADAKIGVAFSTTPAGETFEKVKFVVLWISLKLLPLRTL